MKTTKKKKTENINATFFLCCPSLSTVLFFSFTAALYDGAFLNALFYSRIRRIKCNVELNKHDSQHER